MIVLIKKMRFQPILGVLLLMFMFSEKRGASYAPTLSGIWKCEYDSSMRLKIERSGPEILGYYKWDQGK